MSARQARRCCLTTSVVSVALLLCVSGCGVGSEMDRAACLDDCQCKYSQTCMAGCRTWAGSSALLHWGCQGDCESAHYYCQADCEADGYNSWDGRGPFGGGGVNWGILAKRCTAAR